MVQIMELGGIMKKEELLKNLEKYSHLEKDWDGYGGLPIYKKVLEDSKILIEKFYNNIGYISPCPDGSIWFEIYPKTEGYSFCIVLEENAFSWASVDLDFEKSTEIHDIPLDFDEIEKLIKEYSI